jgi:hypothetical protein
MPADDHLSAALFHGTAHSFNEGDVVKPTDTEHDLTPHAYATTDRDVAHTIASAATRRHNRRNPDDPREPQVYEVEHMSEPGDIWDIPRWMKAVVDPEGFRVKRRV